MNKKLIVLASLCMLSACGDYNRPNHTENNNNQLRGYANDRTHHFGYNEQKNADSNNGVWMPQVHHSHQYNDYYGPNGYYATSPTWQGW